MVRPERRVLLASESLARVSAGAPGSRPQPNAEMRPARAGRQKPLQETGARKRAATLSERCSHVIFSAERCLKGPSHGFEYYRHGTLSLYAALDVKTGKVHGKTAARHTSEEFVDFLGQVVGLCSPQQEIHIILDNLSAHKTKKVTAFLEEHPEVKLHFTPTYSSWLNQVEIWFARVEREVISRGVFTSVKDLARKLMRYIRAYGKNARPFKWKYSDVTRRMKPC